MAVHNFPKVKVCVIVVFSVIVYLIFLVIGSGGRDDPDANQNLGAAAPPLVPEAGAGDRDGQAGEMDDQHVHLVERGIATLAEGLANEKTDSQNFSLIVAKIRAIFAPERDSSHAASPQSHCR